MTTGETERARQTSYSSRRQGNSPAGGGMQIAMCMLLDGKGGGGGGVELSEAAIYTQHHTPMQQHPTQLDGKGREKKGGERQAIAEPRWRMPRR